MINPLTRAAKAATLLSLAGALAACDSSPTGADANENASLSFAALTSATAGSASQQDPIVIGGRTIVVSDIELRLSEIELEGDDAEMEMHGTTILVGVPADGRIVTPVTATVAAGTYTELEMKVQTVRIRGTFDGAPFDVTVNVNEDLETDIRPPLVVEETGTANLTVALVISNWFSNEDGSAIDLLNLNATLESRLKSNINASFDAFEDDDRDGHDGHDD
jgi:hypothetical protein